MIEARFIFQALYPDSAGVPGVPEGAQLVVFDVEYGGKLLSQRIAQLHFKPEGIEVRHDLPFQCPDFAKAAEAYHRLMMEHHGQLLSSSGPKGMRPRNNVFRADWAVALLIEPEHKP